MKLELKFNILPHKYAYTCTAGHFNATAYSLAAVEHPLQESIQFFAQVYAKKAKTIL